MVSCNDGFREISPKKCFENGNKEAFVFLAVIGFVTFGSKVTLPGRSAAFSSLSQSVLTILITQKFYFTNLKNLNNVLSDETSRFGKIRVPERLFII